ncbi:M23 family metallopeptidase [Streptomyces sp. M2CJ-2]|uniref:murein hydrolase activator EnvC family protein n=1 Tax=Streptomyces sp. M2CJ-2 TaxID=2803948 RepID=UPI0019224487|nr:M23 family metallopeptidase [Streptomyces sp. M2CJ-2]MBL3665649.1 M23 family metallopeptidase [Streptomyces sp. M2CJ-2]
MAVLLVLTPTVLLSPPSPPLPLLVARTGDTAPPDADADAADAAGAGAAAPGSGVPSVGRAWPVGIRPRVLRGWEPPETRYGRGHRGVDLAAAPGTPVRAVAAGRVSYAGRVAGRGVVSVELSGTGAPPLRTTYEPVLPSVEKGAEVAPGEVIGTVAATGSHCTAPCLHWGLLRADVYLNPLALLPPHLLGGPSRLLPVLGVPLPE